MPVKFEVNVSDHTIYILIGVVIVFILFSVVSAYNSGLPPSTLGHSSDEIMVDIAGNEKSLQEAINFDFGEDFFEVVSGQSFTWGGDTTSGSGIYNPAWLTGGTGTEVCDAIGRYCAFTIHNTQGSDWPAPTIHQLGAMTGADHNGKNGPIQDCSAHVGHYDKVWGGYYRVRVTVSALCYGKKV